MLNYSRNTEFKPGKKAYQIVSAYAFDREVVNIYYQGNTLKVYQTWVFENREITGFTGMKKVHAENLIYFKYLEICI